jgi:thiol-disulfide isomerase/thioredoxin
MRHPSPWIATALLALLAGCAERERGGVGAPRATVAPPVVPVTAEDIRALAARPGARATLVNVWATWCAPCREEFPALLRVARESAPRGLRLVLVSADFDDQIPAVRSFLAARGVADTSYLKIGDDMEFINGLSAEWTGALPATFVYDRAGRLAAFWEGMADEARFRDAVAPLLASQAVPEEPRP